MTTLTISNINISPDAIKPLGEAIKGLPNLQFLDLSATNMNGNDLNELLTIINRFNGLKSLDLSYNTVKQTKVIERPDNWVIKTLSTFIHFSGSLIHLDLGGMNYS